MAKDILLFGTIWEYNASFFFAQVAEATEDNPEEELALRVNCDGGSPEYAMSIIEKVQEMSGQFLIKGGAQMHSMALFFLCYVDVERAECIDTTQAVLHRGAYPDYVEKSPNFPGSMYEQTLLKTNKDLEAAMRARVDVAALEALPQFTKQNIKLADIFSMDKRVEVLLTAKDLKKIGLVSKVNKITPTKAAVMAAEYEKFRKCASLNEYRIAAQSTTKPIPEPLNNEVMTLEEIKASYPALYNQIKAEGKNEGLAAEADRVAAIMVFNEIDPVGCKAAVESGKPLSQKQMAEFALKNMSKTALTNLENESVPDVITGEAEKPKVAAEVKKENFMAGVKKHLKA